MHTMFLNSHKGWSLNVVKRHYYDEKWPGVRNLSMFQDVSRQNNIVTKVRFKTFQDDLVYKIKYVSRRSTT
jgi:hypothetical protein